MEVNGSVVIELNQGHLVVGGGGGGEKGRNTPPSPICTNAISTALSIKVTVHITQEIHAGNPDGSIPTCRKWSRRRIEATELYLNI